MIQTQFENQIMLIFGLGRKDFYNDPLQQEFTNNPGAIVNALSSVPPKVFAPTSVNQEEIENTLKIVDFEKQAEIVDGKVEIKTLPGLRSSGIAARIAVEIRIYLKTNKIGRLYGSEATFKTLDGNERMADVAFVANEKFKDGEPIAKANFAPD